MINELSTTVEDNFDFSPLSNLTQTCREITETTGTIHYIPTNYPLPLSKRALNSVIGGHDRVRALPMPTNEKNLQETIFAGIDFLLEHDGDASAVFFCPSSLVTQIPQQRGIGFVDTNKIEISDPIHERVSVYQKLSDTSATHTEAEFAPFLLKSYLSLVTEGEPNLTKLQTTESHEAWDLYLPYSELSNVTEDLQEFFLNAIGIQNVKKFLTLPSSGRKSVFEVAFRKKYSVNQDNEYAAFLSTWIRLPANICKLFRELAVTRLTKGRLFNKRLLDLTDSGDREFVENIQKSYSQLFDTEEQINQKDPSEAADRLIQKFGILYHNAPEQDIESLLSKIRSKLSEDSVHVTEYSTSKLPDILGRVEEMLQRTKEVHIISKSSHIGTAIQSESWVESLEEIYRAMIEKDVSGHLDIQYIPALEKAKQNVHLTLETKKEAREIQATKTSLENIPDFFKHWVAFLRESQNQEVNNGVYHNSIVSKYDEFSKMLVSDYDRIHNEDEFTHLSNLLEPSEKLRLVVIIDSLGYTDFELMQQWDSIESSPDVEPVFSNIPSYTPSAMASVLTGLTAEETGIYNWITRKGDSTYNLKNRYDTDEFGFVDQNTPLSYQLLQEQGLMTSGITRFAQQVTDVKLHDGFTKGESLEDLYSTVKSEVNKVLKKRHNAYAGDEDIPEKHRRQKLNAQKSTFVVYLPDFDSLLHDDISIYEFQNYYTTLGRFIDDLSQELLKSLQKYSYDEDYELVFAGDHGKITRYEQDLVKKARTQEPFHQSMLSELTDLEPYNYLNLDRASFTDREGKITIAVGDAEDEYLITQARNVIDTSATDDNILEVIEKSPFVVSGSKFLFGWQAGKAENISLNRFGYDVFYPTGNGVFDLPTVGLLSKYQDKNAPRAHAYHGGTSISEMTAVKLTYTEKDDA